MFRNVLATTSDELLNSTTQDGTLAPLLPFTGLFGGWTVLSADNPATPPDLPDTVLLREAASTAPATIATVAAPPPAASIAASPPAAASALTAASPLTSASLVTSASPVIAGNPFVTGSAAGGGAVIAGSIFTPPPVVPIMQFSLTQSSAPIVMASPPPPPPLTTMPEAVVPQPTAPGQVVGLVLQNPTNGALAAQYISFGSTFADGQVAAGQSLIAQLNGSTEPVQMDVKTTYPDGSVEMAVLTLQQPAIAAGASVPVMLALGGPAVAATPLAISALLTSAANYNVTVALTNITQTIGSTTTPLANVSVNVGTLLAAALAPGGSGVSFWQQGPLATQVRIDTPVAGTAMDLTFDITLYADGSTSTDVQFNNDLMTNSGGTLAYNATISQNGSTAFTQSGLTQYQYQTWNQQIWSNGAPGVNVQQDIAALEKTGVIQNYDTTVGANGTAVDSVIAAEVAQMTAGTGFGVLGNAGILKFMPQTGGRPDIGPTTDANAAWLETQNASAAAYALAEANAAGSVPWHIVDPTTGLYAMLTPGSTLSIPALSPAIPAPSMSGWTIDPAHEPDLAYTAYLMTGDRYYLDQLNAEASYDILNYNSPAQQLSTEAKGALGGGIVADPGTQLRGEAWSLRSIVEAAIANPDGSAEKAYFTRIADTNFQALLAEAASANQGQVSGWIQAVYGYVVGEMAPWQEDYFASTVVLAAQNNIAGARSLLEWMTNFFAGRFLNAAQGFSPYNAIDYNLPLFVGNANTGAYQTWAALGAAAQASPYANNVNNNAWTKIGGDYGALAQATLAGDITVTQSPEAIQAYGWVFATLSQTSWPASLYPNLDIAPRLSDGNLLTANQVFIRNDTGTTPITVQEPTSSDQLIYELGSAPVTLIGGPGMNLLFGGSGPTTLIGGSNNDYLFGGAGATTFESGSGNDYMATGSGAATFVLATTDIGADIIAGFRIGTDHLEVIGEAPSSAAIVSLIAGATQDAGGDAILHLSAAHSVTLQGISTARLAPSLFS